LRKILWYLPVLFKLGINNVLYIVWYRWSLKTGFRKSCFPVKFFKLSGDLFVYGKISAPQIPLQSKEQLIENADKILSGQLKYYSYHWKKVGSPPNWFINPFNGSTFKKSHLHWTELADFDPEVGDIKNVWEASRFDWVVTLARAYSVSGNKKYIDTSNRWLEDWTKKNPINIGPHWKCGQEVSIRVFNLLNAAFILDHQNASEPFKNLIYYHLKRVHKNILYAIAQNNNHGTSEAAALFIGGCWLQSFGDSDFPKATIFANTGRKWLENRVKNLVDPDGSFSQHSVNYHRLMLDTLCFAEFWRITLDVKPFSGIFYEKAKAATNWLWIFTDEVSGNSPNLGANDGALFLNFHNCSYLDFRPTIQFSHILFKKSRRFGYGPWDEPLYWLNLDTSHLPIDNSQRNTVILDQAYGIFIQKDSWALIRLPHFHFRPSHNDVFHFDLWYNHENIICDTGSFSYNPGTDKPIVDFISVRMHNTVMFDGHDQMPKLGRFLLGNWIYPEKIGPIIDDENSLTWEGSYKDSCGNLHSRKISSLSSSWIIEDWFSGKFKSAIIGFNLSGTSAVMEENKIILPWGIMNIEGASKIRIEGIFISNYYWAKTTGQRIVIEADLGKPIITTISLGI
jgi:hypothetical protein